MTINIRQNTTTLLTEDRTVIQSSTSEIFVLTPAEGKYLKNTLTGEIHKKFVYVNKKEQISNFIEIDEEY